MKTPITASADDYQIRAVAQKLERDRAALMDALCEIHIISHDYSGEGSIALKAIEAARAKFPEQ